MTVSQWLQSAVIRENECVGCTKCIQACPYDAILGANKLMHTVLTDYCTGCGLCVPACPFDCIDLVAKAKLEPEKQVQFEILSQQRNSKHELRLQENREPMLAVSEDRKAVIAAAVSRNKHKISKNG